MHKVMNNERDIHMNENDSAVIVLRFNEFDGHDFIQEHKSIIREKGFVWMLKMGRRPSADRLASAINQSQKIVLCSPRKTGYKMYLCNAVDYYIGNAREDISSNVPEYYNKIKRKNNIRVLGGTWFKITSISEMSEDLRSCIYLISNNRKLEDVIKETRTAVIYAYVNSTKL